MSFENINAPQFVDFTSVKTFDIHDGADYCFEKGVVGEDIDLGFDSPASTSLPIYPPEPDYKHKKTNSKTDKDIEKLIGVLANSNLNNHNNHSNNNDNSSVNKNMTIIQEKKETATSIENKENKMYDNIAGEVNDVMTTAMEIMASTVALKPINNTIQSQLNQLNQLKTPVRSERLRSNSNSLTHHTTTATSSIKTTPSVQNSVSKIPINQPTIAQQQNQPQGQPTQQLNKYKINAPLLPSSNQNIVKKTFEKIFKQTKVQKQNDVEMSPSVAQKTRQKSVERLVPPMPIHQGVKFIPKMAKLSKYADGYGLNEGFTPGSSSSSSTTTSTDQKKSDNKAENKSETKNDNNKIDNKNDSNHKPETKSESENGQQHKQNEQEQPRKAYTLMLVKQQSDSTKDVKPKETKPVSCSGISRSTPGKSASFRQNSNPNPSGSTIVKHKSIKVSSSTSDHNLNETNNKPENGITRKKSETKPMHTGPSHTENRAQKRHEYDQALKEKEKLNKQRDIIDDDKTKKQQEDMIKLKMQNTMRSRSIKTNNKPIEIKPTADKPATDAKASNTASSTASNLVPSISSKSMVKHSSSSLLQQSKLNNSSNSGSGTAANALVDAPLKVKRRPSNSRLSANNSSVDRRSINI